MKDDSISRQAVLDKFEPWLKVKDYNDGELNMLKAILYEIRFMPPATDTNVGAKHGTNLAEVGTNCISRRQAIDAIRDMQAFEDDNGCSYLYLDDVMAVFTDEEELPSAQPDIVWCKDCKYAEYIDDVQTLWCTECGQGRTVAPCDFCSYAEKREVTKCD